MKDERERLGRCVRNDRGISYLNFQKRMIKSIDNVIHIIILATFIVIMAMIGR